MIGALLGGLFGASSAKKQRQMIADERAKNQTWYNRRYNEGASAQSVAARKQLMDYLRGSSEAAEGRAAVMGASNAQRAATANSQAEAVAKTEAAIAQNEAARKDAVESAYRQRDAQLAGQQLGAEQSRGRAIQGAASGLEDIEKRALRLFM